MTATRWIVPAALVLSALLAGCSDGLQTPQFSRESEVVAADTPAVSRLRAGAAKANLIIILVDAARADRFGAFGYTRGITPQLDRFFTEATLLTHAYAPAADTKASVSSLFTAQYPDTHGVLGRLIGLSPDDATLAECMRSAGYATAAFSANPYLSASFGFARGFDSFFEVFREVDIQPMGVGAVDGAILLKGAIGWLRARQAEPFLLYLHFLEPHAPYTPPAAFRERIADPDDPSVSGELLDYEANLAYVDHLVGQLLDELERLGLLDESVVVFLSDHGEAFGEHGVYRHERVAYQEMVHVPVAFRLPSRCRAPRQARAETFSPTDIMPTVLDLLQIAPPGTMQGRSRLGLLAGEDEMEPTVAVSRARGDDWTGGVERPEQVSYGIREGGYTLILGSRGKQAELYHHQADPAERRNVAQQHPQVVERLQRRFRSWAATQRARPPVLRGGTVFVSDTKRVFVDKETRRRLRDLGYLK